MNSTASPIGLVLAGGNSTRFGSPKAAVRMSQVRFTVASLDGPDSAPNDPTLLEWSVRRMRSVCNKVFVANRTGEEAELPVSMECNAIADGPGKGPAAALLGAHLHDPAAKWLVLACDLPAVPVPLLQDLAHKAASGTVDLVLPVGPSGREPLCALYGPRALRAVHRRAQNGEFSLQSVADTPGLNSVSLEGDSLLQFGVPERIFHNINRPVDLAGACDALPNRPPSGVRPLTVTSSGCALVGDPPFQLRSRDRSAPRRRAVSAVPRQTPWALNDSAAVVAATRLEAAAHPKTRHHG